MEKLYYQDPYIKEFKAQLLHQNTDEQGNLYAVLNQTAFYPTGGGQPHDTGTLSGVEVVAVEDVDDEIRHYIKMPLPQGEIEGRIDWSRRLDHMQQHTGQHVLSAAFAELFNYQTVSFHLGKEICTIDIHTNALGEDEATAAEALANEIVFENRPIETKWISAAEITQYPLRKQPSVTENIRLVIIPDFDYNGCGGTHPSSTGQVSSIKILDWEKQKQNIRVQFVCGNRVLKQLHEKHKVMKQLTAALNAPQEDVADAAMRIIQDAKILEKNVENKNEQLLFFEAKELLNQHKTEDNVQAVFNDRSIKELQTLARKITELADDSVVILVNELEDKLQFVCASGNGSGANMKKLAKELLSSINGKGGGNESFAQGGGPKGMSGEELLQIARQILSDN
ncbi:alanyl-tRNA editing protein [Cytobacillus gottheilii]|uniref:Alanyl-tRNA editing protein n=1 Tax=Cytobacillus gottheilii TaxID=859144 RepID=A0ABX8FE17_9BACI|nr:DHHA1 domain-containing protein [Cytobacillus gottheilii]QVY61872.1 alanyl-tRNA editing protein [Cytobacillus gottheilii]